MLIELHASAVDIIAVVCGAITIILCGIGDHSPLYGVQTSDLGLWELFQVVVVSHAD